MLLLRLQPEDTRTLTTRPAAAVELPATCNPLRTTPWPAPKSEWTRLTSACLSILPVSWLLKLPTSLPPHPPNKWSCETTELGALSEETATQRRWFLVANPLATAVMDHHHQVALQSTYSSFILVLKFLLKNQFDFLSSHRPAMHERFCHWPFI